MTAVTLPNTGIKTGFTLGENGWNDEVNRALRVLDALVQPTIIDKDLTAPPGSPTQGAVYIVGPAATGAWSGQAGKLACWQAGDDLASAWTFIDPREGWRVWATDENAYYQYDGAAWIEDTTGSAGATRYDTTIGDAAAADFVVTHGLGTRKVHVTVYRTASPYDTIVTDVERTTTNTVRISGFSAAPALNEYTVLVSK